MMPKCPKNYKKAKKKQGKVLEMKGNRNRDAIKLFFNSSVCYKLLSNCTSQYNNIIGIKHSHQYAFKLCFNELIRKR